MNRLNRIFTDRIAVGLIFIFVAVFFSDILFGGRVFIGGESISSTLPSKILLFRQLFRGQFPLWNPYTSSGTPFLADSNFGLLSPFNLTFAFFPPFVALNLAVVFPILIAGLGMYLYSRKMGVTVLASLISSMVYAFSGSLMTHILVLPILNVVVWIPFILLFTECLLRTGSLKYALLTSIFLAFSFFGGHVLYFYYTVLLLFSYLIMQPLPIKQKTVYLGYIFIPTLLLTAAQSVPFLEYAMMSTRPARNLQFAGSVSLVSFIRLIIPNFFGVLKDGTSWGATADILGYVGIIPLLLIFLTLGLKKDRTQWFFIVLCAVSFMMALGYHSPVYLFAFYFLPLFDRFRFPGGILILYTFGSAFLAGRAADGIKKIKHIPYVLIVLAVLLTVLYLLSPKIPLFLHDAMVTINAIKKTGFITRFLEYSPQRSNIIFSLWFENVFIILLLSFFFFLTLFLQQKKAVSKQAMQFIFLILIVSDLFFFAQNDLVTASKNSLQIPESLRSLFSKEKKPFRILLYPDPGAKPPFNDPSYFEAEAKKAYAYLLPNVNIIAGVESITGYISIVRKDYSRYLSETKSNDPTRTSLPIPGSRQIDELNVKYLITGGNMMKELSSIPHYKKVLRYVDPVLNRTFTVFENSNVLPRAYLLRGDNFASGSAQIISFEPAKITVQTQSASNARLVLSEMMYPGWNVTIDERKYHIKPYNNIFRSVEIPQGKHTVVFTYFPLMVYAALTLSLVNWVYVVGFLCILLYKEHKKIRHKLHIGKSNVKNNP